MNELTIQLDFLAGPIWKEIWDVHKNIEITGIAAIDEDDELASINDEIQQLYSSYYSFDSNGEACTFDNAQEKADKDRMLSLLRKLLARIEELNDGSFTVVDLETPRVNSL